MTPIEDPSAVAPMPTANDIRAPWTIRLQTSRPNESVPIQCRESGEARRCAESTLSGEKRQSRSADIALQTNITMLKSTMGAGMEGWGGNPEPAPAVRRMGAGALQFAIV